MAIYGINCGLRELGFYTAVSPLSHLLWGWHERKHGTESHGMDTQSEEDGERQWGLSIMSMGHKGISKDVAPIYICVCKRMVLPGPFHVLYSAPQLHHVFNNLSWNGVRLDSKVMVLLCWRIRKWKQWPDVVIKSVNLCVFPSSGVY